MALPETAAKFDGAAGTAMAVIPAGAATMWGALNDWASAYSPAVTFLFGLVAAITGIGTLIYKFWDTKVKRNQRIRDRALAHRQIEHEQWLAGREQDDHK